MQENKVKERNSNFELLRIILTLMIITLHYLHKDFGGALQYTTANTFNYYLIHIIESFCIVAVNVFILITGYHMNGKEKVKISKVLNLVALTAFYGIAIFLVYSAFNGFNFDTNTIMQAVKTITDSWFVVIYCILYLLIPYINKVINSIDKKQFKTLLTILFIFFSIWPTIWTNTTVKDGGYGIINLVFLYLIGAYIKIHGNEKTSILKSSSVYLICTALTTIFSMYAERAYAYNNVINIISAIALFDIFKVIKLKTNKCINYIATYTFSTYIIHVNSFIIVDLYRKLFKCDQYYNSNLLIVNLILTVLGIYIICIVIEFIRRVLFKKVIDGNISKIKTEIKA